ncbi:MAG: 6-hydroxymethylpterin diphosphokinase MptE-like protein [Candidatus Nitrosotenuis sp.]
MAKDSSSKELQKSIEDIMKKKQYEHFEEWVTNFSLNLPSIWNERSAKELTPSVSTEQKENSAIVIGRGPSINKHEHLKLLASSDYRGTIVCCDGKLIDALNAGVTPDKFPKYFVTTIDPYPSIKQHYEHEIIKSYGSNIKGVFTVITNPNVVERARQSGIQIHWLHSLFDYNEGVKSFNNLSALMIRARNNLHRLPGIQTGGNVGTASWFIAWQILKCSIVALIGINHGWEEDDSWETIIHHNNKSEISEVIDRNNPLFNKLFRKIYNPDFNCNCILDPLFQFYSEALKEFIERSPEWVTTINATEGGSIFGNRIKSMKFKEFLEKYHS